jgi:type VI secretion system protein ImpK
MSRDDPFGLSDDRDRTRIRLVAAPPPVRQYPAPPPGAPLKRTRAHPNALINAFAPLLEFAPEMENALPPENPEALRTRLLEELVTARDAAIAGGSSLARADAAAWSVAALLDDLALNTPWGGASAWPRQPLVVMLRGDVDAGTQFFARLEELERHPNRDRELLELQYQCLALGFRGKYRVPGRAGDRSISAVRASAARFLRNADAETAPLSPHWRGVIAADEPSRFIVPIWVLGASALALATAIHIGLSMQLSGQAEKLSTLVSAMPPFERAAVVRQAREQPVTPATPVGVGLLPEFQAAAPPNLAQALKGRENVSLTTLIIQGSNPEVFQSSRAQLTDGFEPLIASLARVIQDNQELIGDILVVGHTDSVPLQSSNPLSTNQRLSEARAVTIANILIENGVPRERVRAEGRAATKPIADNKTRAGRALNRRVEVLIEKRM